MSGLDTDWAYSYKGLHGIQLLNSSVYNTAVIAILNKWNHLHKIRSKSYSSIYMWPNITDYCLDANFTGL